MSLLFPLYLLGALAIAVPVLLHLTGRPPKNRVPFSSLMFLKKTDTPLKQKRRVEDPLLMLLRCLALALLVFIFTRPFFGNPPENLSRDPEELLAIVIDSSASMRRSGLWEQAVAEAEKVIQKTTDNDRVSVFHFNRELHPLVTFETWGKWPAAQRKDHALDSLKAIKPSWRETQLGKALVGVAEAMEDDDVEQKRSFKNRKLILISDLQAGSRLERIQTYEWPGEIELEFVRLDEASGVNAGLHAVLDQDAVGEADPSVRIWVRNSSESERSDFNLQWEKNKAQNRMRQVTVEPGQSRTVLFPGLRLEAEGRSLKLSGDEVEFDNTLYLAPPVTHRIHVLYSGKEAVSDPKNALYYLSRVMRPSGAVEPMLHIDGDADAAFAEIDFWVASTGLNEQDVERMQTHLKSGKDALFVFVKPEDAETLGRILDQPDLKAEEYSASDYSMLAEMDFEHALLKYFQGKAYGDFTKLRFWKHRKIEVEQIPDAHVFARFDNDDPAWFECPVGKGSLYVMTAGWHPADSQFALSSKFLPLLFSMVEQSGGQRFYQNQFKVGDEVPLSESDGQIKITAPSGGETMLPAGSKSFAATHEPGLYTVHLPDRQWRFAVNLDPVESKTEMLDAVALKQLENIAKSTDVEAGNEETSYAMINAERESQQKLWKRILLILLFVIGIEILVAGHKKNQKPAEAPV